MPSRISKKRDSPRRIGRFGKYARRSSVHGVDGNGGSESEHNTRKSLTLESHGPLQPQPGAHHQDIEITPPSTWGLATPERSRRCFSSHASIDDENGDIGSPTSASADKGILAFGRASSTGTGENELNSPPIPPATQSIDDDVDDCALVASTSSDNAMFAFGRSSSTGGDAANKVNSQTSPEGNSRQTPPTPSTPDRYNQYLRSRAGRAALETPKNNDDASWAWWFLASISESFDTFQSNISGHKTPQQQQQQTATANARRKLPQIPGHKSPLKTNGREVSRKYDSAYELPSLRSSDRHISQQSEQNSPDKEQMGGEYTLKEQQIRKDWLGNDTLGGTVAFDRQVSAPYHFIPPQHASLAPNASSDPELKTQFSYNVEWTPQDSSYGAAIPAFGWIPQRKRKLLEIILVLVLAALLITVVVKTGIMLKSSGSGGGEEIFFDDDDHYAAYDESSHSEDNASNDGSDSSDDDNG